MEWFFSSLGGDSNVQFLLHFLEVLSRLKVCLGNLNSLIHKHLLLQKYSRGGLQLLWLDETKLLNLGSDGTDIGHGTCPSSVTIAALKQRLLSMWPQDKSVVPESVTDIKLIHAGKFLENGKTLAESGVQADDLPGEVVTMHVVVQPSGKPKKGSETEEKQNQGSCACTIL